MKKIIVSLALASLFFACKEETKDKMEEATEAFSNDVKDVVDSAKIKAETKLDTMKAKANAEIDSVKLKSAAKMEAAAKKLNESVKK